MKTIFITGATSGIGQFAACESANDGNRIIALARSESKGIDLTTYFSKNYPKAKGKIEIVVGTLSSMQSILASCAEVHRRTEHLDMLINNAGTWTFKFTETEDGIEEIFQVNVLAVALNINELLPLLKKGSDAKIINTSSALHQDSIDFDDIEFRNKKFSGFRAYRQSKLGVILIGRHLAPKLESSDIGIYSQHPGVVRTKLGRHAGWFARFMFYLIGSSVAKGTKTLLFLMRTSKPELESGAYYAKQKPTLTTTESQDLNLAAKLMGVIKSYLSKCTESSNL